MKKFLATLVVIAVVGGLAWLNWDRVAPIVGLAPTPAPTVGPTSLGAAPEQRHRFALIDPTTSTDTSFREAMKADLIAAIGGYLPPKTDTPKAGSPAVAGIQLTVRLVGTNSLAYGQQNAAIDIPSIPALPAAPDMTIPGALDPDGPYDAWKESATAWSTAYDAALAAQATGVQTLQSLNLDLDESSGITAGAAALALLAPADGDVAFAVLSDLDENRDQQAAQFNGHPILVVQPDPFGDIGRWDALYGTFSDWAEASGAGALTRVRPEAASTALTAFVTGS